MSVRTIRIYPDSILRRRSDSVGEVTGEIQKLAEDMVHTLRWANGVGLAAPQIGELLRVIVIDPGIVDSSKEPICIINPEIMEENGSQIAEEGCLSIPGIYEKLKRASSVLVKGLDTQGNPIDLEFNGILARAISHEVDHLNGILFIDRLSPIRRSLLKGRLKKLKEEEPDHSQHSQLF